MRKTFDYWMIVVAYFLRYVYVAVVVWEFWLAMPFVSGYNWHTTVAYLGRALLMYLCGCFLNGELAALQTFYMTKYPAEKEWYE